MNSPCEKVGASLRKVAKSCSSAASQSNQMRRNGIEDRQTAFFSSIQKRADFAVHFRPHPGAYGQRTYAKRDSRVVRCWDNNDKAVANAGVVSYFSFGSKQYSCHLSTWGALLLWTMPVSIRRKHCVRLPNKLDARFFSYRLIPQTWTILKPFGLGWRIGYVPPLRVSHPCTTPCWTVLRWLDYNSTSHRAYPLLRYDAVLIFHLRS